MLSVINQQTATLSGDLSFETVPGLLEDGRKAIHNAKEEWTVDMSTVGSVSSVSVALLVDWIRIAEQANTRLRIRGLPEQMLSIIDLCDLTPLFAPVIDTNRRCDTALILKP